MSMKDYSFVCFTCGVPYTLKEFSLHNKHNFLDKVAFEAALSANKGHLMNYFSADILDVYKHQLVNAIECITQHHRQYGI